MYHLLVLDRLLQTQLARVAIEFVGDLHERKGARVNGGLLLVLVCYLDYWLLCRCVIQQFILDLGTQDTLSWRNRR